MKIIEKRKIWYTISLIIILAGLIAMPIYKGSTGTELNYDIEFSGGTTMYINIGQEFDPLTDIRPIVIETTGETSPQIQEIVGKNQVVIKTKELDTDTRTALFNALAEKYDLESGKDGDLLNVQNISPTISGEMKKSALLAVGVATVLMLLYITLRFRDYRFGISAVLALAHDVLIVLAVYSLLRVPINNSFIAAMLTIVGYSINDTIVLFDRVRENQKRMKRGHYTELVNKSIMQTLGRSINTSLTTLITITLVYLFGVPSIKEFALPLMVGILSGTYSSIFIASPLWYQFKRKEEQKYAKA